MVGAGARRLSGGLRRLCGAEAGRACLGAAGSLLRLLVVWGACRVWCLRMVGA